MVTEDVKQNHQKMAPQKTRKADQLYSWEKTEEWIITFRFWNLDLVMVNMFGE